MTHTRRARASGCPEFVTRFGRSRGRPEGCPNAKSSAALVNGGWLLALAID
jgi:hypothetical protein